MSFTLGNLTLDKPIILAPIDGYTDVPFRLVVKMMQPDLMYTEFVNSDAVMHSNKKTLNKIRILPEERPVAIQVFGKNPANMAVAAQMLEEYQPEILDLNFGCPAPNVTAGGFGSGSALLRDLPLLGKICEAVVKSVKLPVTAKTRIGWDMSSVNILETARVMKESGIQMITLHPRTRSQKFLGKSDWSYIKLLKENTDLPVIGNGDILNPYDAKRMFDETGCDGVMIAREAIKNPWIFQQIKDYLATGTFTEEIPLVQRQFVCLKHLDWAIEFKGAERAQFEMRKLYQNYFRGIPNLKRFKRLVFATTDENEVRNHLLNFENIINDTSIDNMELVSKDKWSGIYPCL